MLHRYPMARQTRLFVASEPSLGNAGGFLGRSGTDSCDPILVQQRTRADPFGDLTLSGSTLYGMAYEGGTNNQGTIFSIPISGGTPTTLFSFDGTNGANPNGSLTLSGSTLYGMTEGGGANGYGVIFSVPVTGGTPTILFPFDNTNGREPYASLTLSGSTLYGTTYFGGADASQGTAFSIQTTGGTPTVLSSFGGAVRTNPSGNLTLSGSTLYGMTEYGGASGSGAVFSVAVTGGTPTVLCSLKQDHRRRSPGVA